MNEAAAATATTTNTATQQAATSSSDLVTSGMVTRTTRKATVAVARRAAPTESKVSMLSTLWASAVGFIPGAVGGFGNVLCGHPIDLVKVRMQTASVGVQPPSIVGTVRSVLVQDGVTGLYAGVTGPMLCVIPAFAITFWTYDRAIALQFYYSDRNNNNNIIKSNAASTTANNTNALSLAQIAVAGGLTGIPLGLMFGPTEHIKCLLQVPDYKQKFAGKGFVGCAATVFQERGMAGLFRGTGLTIARDVPGNAAYFCAAEVTQRILRQYYNNNSNDSYDYDNNNNKALPVWVTLLSGGVAGMANWIVAIPLDVIKSRWQTANPIDKYRSVTDVVTELVRQGGLRALTKGVGPALVRAFVANAACFGGVATARWALQDNNNR